MTDKEIKNTAYYNVMKKLVPNYNPNVRLSEAKGVEIAFEMPKLLRAEVKRLKEDAKKSK